MQSTYVIKELKGIDPAFEQYRALVLATWMRSLQNGSEFFGMIDSRTFFETYSKIILSLLKRPDCVIRLAVLSADNDVVVGWSAFEGKVLHFVYVRPGTKEASARKCGVATNLIPKNFEIATHMTRTGRSIWKKKFKEVKFNPF